MKNIFKLLTLSSLSLLLLWSCKKDENKDYFLGGKPPVLTATSNTSADSIALHYADSSKAALQLSWTNPDYQFTTGISSQDVNYQVQIDTVGADFSNPQLMQVISVNKGLSLNITEAQLDGYMLNQLGLKDSVPHQIELRIMAAIGTNAVPLMSNVAKFTATPYKIPPKVTPPASDTLYITGDATADDWMTDASSVAGQGFTRISHTEYTITIKLNGGAQYLFIGVAGDWNSKYGCNNTTTQSPNGGDFEFSSSSANMPAPANTGTYKIDVDFQRGKYTVTAQ